jgi:hypothetical protein
MAQMIDVPSPGFHLQYQKIIAFLFALLLGLLFWF